MRTTTISGRLGANAEVKMTKKGTQYLQFRMASQEYGDENPFWVNVTSFNSGDINRAKWFTQGKPVNVIGTFRPTAWTNKQGQQTAGLDVNAYSIEWVSSERQDGDNNNSTPKSNVPQATQRATPKAASTDSGMVVTNGPASPFTANAAATQTVDDGDLPF